MQRRELLQTLLLGSTALMLGGGVAGAAEFPVTKTNAEWQRLLKPEVYKVLRLQDTEYPGTSPLLKEHRKGTFACAGCDQALFASNTKFESGTGWPSFWQPINARAVGTYVDKTQGMVRTEVHCSRCGGHLGHIFEDGPKPTGLRYCINGLALTFKPATA
jgi:peptide-methionine (R)-S-oxide reductase